MPGVWQDGTKWSRLGDWCAPVHAYIQVSGQTAKEGSPVGTFDRVVLLGLVISPCAQADTAGKITGRLMAIQSQKSLQPAESHP